MICAEENFADLIYWFDQLAIIRWYMVNDFFKLNGDIQFPRYFPDNVMLGHDERFVILDIFAGMFKFLLQQLTHEHYPNLSMNNNTIRRQIVPETRHKYVSLSLNGRGNSELEWIIWNLSRLLQPNGIRCLSKTWCCGPQNTALVISAKDSVFIEQSITSGVGRFDSFLLINLPASTSLAALVHSKLQDWHNSDQNWLSKAKLIKRNILPDPASWPKNLNSRVFRPSLWSNNGKLGNFAPEAPNV